MEESKLLLNEEPLLVMPQLATKIGLNESLILQQIHYWNKINAKSNNNFRDGYYWTFNTYEKWKEQFPFWSVDTIRRTISKLEKMGLVVSGNYNKMKIDRTKWYRIDYKVLHDIESFPLVQNAQMDNSKMHRPIPETTQRHRNPKRKPTKNNKSEYKDFALEAVADFAENQIKNNVI